MVLSKKRFGICTRVLDGDTVVVSGQKIRLADLDAPELGQNSLDGVAIGKQSQQFLARLILGKKVEVRYTGRGYYGRIIGTIFYNGKNINQLIMQAGMATTYGSKYQEINYQAKLIRQGIYKTFGFKSPKYYRSLKRKVKTRAQ